MLKIQEIRELIKLIDESSIDEFKFEQNGSKVTMKKQSDQPVSSNNRSLNSTESTKTNFVQEVQPQQEVIKEESVPSNEKEIKVVDENKASNEKLHTITSPMVGTFYESPSPDSAPYVKSGDKVNQESVVCIVEAMKLMNEIEAEINGEIVEVLVENGQLVEYGQELFLVKPE
ncbi:acetyl-CoA carboxylase biotin carboxyl carrier protein [Salipaludibacillus daqingensis]|uniref:acetyl-CoA carboxylase biotin carboxyl carrier protein n=1 Tax=Salipaludibacillus daqingensis TaxID=3041001 RepID=UPI002472F623|nr:acetyl-CoA carboxylase biotin carboxyl carrier protein [Salipaludibacillus daqingensis]